ncbi:MAG: transposase [Gammaproteobacteria bacterium]|nr:transposase [Gammaproteobacteria bacterium]
MSQRKIRKYDKEFKQNAVNLCSKNDRPCREIAKDLGIAPSTLASWIEACQKDGSEAFPGKGHLKPSDAEVAQLRKELAHVREERDILKKALGIFSSLRK